MYFNSTKVRVIIILVKLMKTYICIDLKSFYASVECRERNLDPITTNLVVADVSRTEKTICLAVSPSLKSIGLGGRARLFEVVQKVREINIQRKIDNNRRPFTGKSYNINELKNNKSLELDYIAATPRMSLYIKYSAMIYNTYLKYIAPEDIHVYSIDEVFCDVTNYLNYYHMSASELATKMIKDVYDNTGITATAGIGTNMYLCKVAMDIVAKHTEANEFGVRIAELDEDSYRRKLWSHKPLTDFWRVGRGYIKKLEKYNLHTMGDIARCSINNEELLYKLFGVNAELLIDHAWGVEPCTMKDVKSFKPSSNSLGSGQVLHCPYDYKKAKLIVREMTDALILDLVEKKLVTDIIVLTIGYDIENCLDGDYDGEVVVDYYGREVPKSAHGTTKLEYKTSSTDIIIAATMELFEKIINPKLLVRRINVVFGDTLSEEKNNLVKKVKQFDLFSNFDNFDEEKKEEKKNLKDERKLQEVMINLKKKYGKNAILKGMNLEEGSTAIDRNNQIGGHRA